MLAFVKNILGTKVSPIGVDFGSDSLKMAQVHGSGRNLELLAAGSVDVPSHIRHDASGRLNFYTDAIREILASAKFRGRQAVLGLPASSMYIQHLRLPPMDEEALRKALPWESRGKLPIDPSHALLRHMVAGEVYAEQEQKSEVIVFAAARDMVNQLLAAASRAKLDVIGMTVEPAATVDCFHRVYRREADDKVVNCFIDLGASGTRCFISRGSQIFFARSITIGGDHLSRSVSAALKIRLEDAKLRRMAVCEMEWKKRASREASPAGGSQTPASSQPAPAADAGNQLALLTAAMQAHEKAAPPAAPGTPPPAGTERRNSPKAERPLDLQMEEAEGELALIQQCCREPLSRLVEELDLCRRYYEATFPQMPIERLIFVGGEARHRWLCQYLARELGVTATVGDPLARMPRNQAGSECGIDRAVPQPNWTVALGLSMGPREAAQLVRQSA